MDKSQGIILKSYWPERHRVVLLDAGLGLVEAGVLGADYRGLSHGMVIEYMVQKGYGKWVKISSIELIYVPNDLGRRDIFFFHHVLELCIRFVPPQVPVPEVFEMVKILYRSFDEICEAPHGKILFTLRLLIVMGVYPEGDIFNNALFHQLISEPVSDMLKKALSPKSQRCIETWLSTILAFHDRQDVSLKTRAAFGGLNEDK